MTMKRVYTYIIYSVLVALSLLACNNPAEDITLPDAPAMVEMSVTAIFDSDTRTAIDEANSKVVWSEGDTLKIIETASNNTTFKDTSSIAIDNSGKATFSVAFEASSATSFAYDAIYPASAVDTSGSTSARVMVEVKDEQVPSATSFDPAADILVAKHIVTETQPTELSMRFKRLVALGKIVIKGLPESCAIAKVTFTAEGHAIAGINYVDVEAGMVTEYGYEVSEAITMSYATAITTRDIYFTCNPFTLSAGDSFSIEVVCDNGDRYIKNISLPESATFSFSKGDLSIFSVNLDGCKVTNNENIDILTREKTGIANEGGYKSWNYISARGITYAGHSAGANNSIQLRAGHESGIVITNSNNLITKIIINWDANTSKGRTLNIYGKSSPYTATSDLYDTSLQGTLLGTIVKETSTELTINDEYSYIGICVKSDVAYLSDIEVHYASNTPSFYISHAECNFTAQGGTEVINVVPVNGFDATVTATSEAEWLNIARNGYSYSVSAETNSGDARTTTILFSAAGYESFELCVTQAAGNNRGWMLVTSAQELATGDKIIIAAKNEEYALSTTQNDNNRARTAITKSEDSITFDESTQIITLDAGVEAATYALNVDNGYLTSISSTKNYLHTVSDITTESSWSIDIAQDGTATVTACGTYTRNMLQYYRNNDTGYFTCFGTQQQDIVIYKLYN